MKLFSKFNYYEILDITPDATPFEIRHAYNMALQLYQDSSLASYSFFTEDERKKILSRVDIAFSTLVDEVMRSEYDKTLFHIGVQKDSQKKLQKRQLHKQSEEDLSPGTALPSADSKKRKTEIHREILAQDVITGNDLKRVRSESGITLEEISERTKIWIEFLRDIENDKFDKLPSRVFLKGFLKAYVNYCFTGDLDAVVDRYMKRF